MPDALNDVSTSVDNTPSNFRPQDPIAFYSSILKDINGLKLEVSKLEDNSFNISDIKKIILEKNDASSFSINSDGRVLTANEPSLTTIVYSSSENLGFLIYGTKKDLELITSNVNYSNLDFIKVTDGERTIDLTLEKFEDILIQYLQNEPQELELPSNISSNIISSKGYLIKNSALPYFFDRPDITSTSHPFEYYLIKENNNLIQVFEGKDKQIKTVEDINIPKLEVIERTTINGLTFFKVVKGDSNKWILNADFITIDDIKNFLNESPSDADTLEEEVLQTVKQDTNFVKKQKKPLLDLNESKERQIGMRVQSAYSTVKGSAAKFDFYLAPAMQSTFRMPGGLDVPNALPGGLNIRIIPNIGKVRIPGSKPIYQNLGIDSVTVTVIGAFTGGNITGTFFQENTADIGNNPNEDLDTYRDYNEFIKLIDLGEELDVEINLQQHNQDNINFLNSEGDIPITRVAALNPIERFSEKAKREFYGEGTYSDNAITYLRQRNGNPRFRGFLRDMQYSFRRKNIAYYVMQFEITDFDDGTEEEVCIDYKPAKLFEPLDSFTNDENDITETSGVYFLQSFGFSELTNRKDIYIYKKEVDKDDIQELEDAGIFDEYSFRVGPPEYIANAKYILLLAATEVDENTIRLIPISKEDPSSFKFKVYYVGTKQFIISDNKIIEGGSQGKRIFYLKDQQNSEEEPIPDHVVEQKSITLYLSNDEEALKNYESEINYNVNLNQVLI